MLHVEHTDFDPKEEEVLDNIVDLIRDLLPERNFMLLTTYQTGDGSYLTNSTNMEPQEISRILHALGKVEEPVAKRVNRRRRTTH